MTNTIAVDITLYSEDGELWASQAVTFDLLTELATTSDGVVIRKTNTVTTDGNGAASTTLAIPDDGYWLYKCTLPLGSFRFTLASTASNTTLEALLSAQNLEETVSASTLSTLLGSYLQTALVLDEDDMDSDDDTYPATQQSVKAYVDGAVSASGVATSGTPVANDIARFTDASTIEGLSYAELITAAALLGTAGGTMAGNITMADYLITRPVIKDYGETVNAIGSIGGGTQDIDLTLGNVVSGTVDTSTTTFTFSNPSASGTNCSFTLYLTNGASQTVNWPASVDWAGGTAPTLTASGVDILTFTTLDGGTIWYGFAAGLDMQ